ncbi:MAG: hypothetical protein AAGH83_01950 [Pseudomonadota bacterium]
MTVRNAGQFESAIQTALTAIETAIDEAKDDDTKTLIRDNYIGRTGLLAEMDAGLMKQAREELAKHTKPMRKATDTLIALLKEQSIIDAFKAAHPPEKLGVYRDLLPLLPVIDTFDPATRDLANPKAEMARRFSQSGRVSISGGNSILALEVIAKTFQDVKVRVSVDNSDTIIWTGDTSASTFKTDIARYKRLFPKPKKGWKFENQPGDLAGTMKTIFDLSVPVMSVATMYLEEYADASAGAAKHAAELAHVEQIIAAMLPTEADIKKAIAAGTKPGEIGVDLKGALTQAKGAKFDTTMKQAKAAQFALAIKALGIFDALYAFNKELLKPGTTAEDKRNAFKAASKAFFVVLDGAADIFGRLTGRTAIGTIGGAFIAIPLLALDADAAYASIDAATRSGDLSIAVGEAIALAGSTALAVAGVMMLYAEFVAASSFGGPIAIGVTLVIGLVLLIAGKTIAAAFIDKPMEVFAKNCVFGKTPEDQPNDALKAHFGFGLDSNPNMGVQKARLFELQNPLGISYNTSLESLTLSFDIKKIVDLPEGVTIEMGWTKPVQFNGTNTLKKIPETDATRFKASQFWKGQTFLENIPSQMTGAFVEARVKLPSGAGTMRNWVKLP